MFKPRLIGAAASTALVLVGAPASHAGVVRPGETVVVTDAELTMPEGAVLARSVLSFSIDYEASGSGSFVEFGGTTGGPLTSTVVRDGLTGTLVFVYDVDYSGDAGANASEASVLTVNGFAPFATDVTGALDYERVILASRTDDASGVMLSSD